MANLQSAGAADGLIALEERWGATTTTRSTLLSNGPQACGCSTRLGVDTSIA